MQDHMTRDKDTTSTKPLPVTQTPRIWTDLAEAVRKAHARARAPPLMQHNWAEHWASGLDGIQKNFSFNQSAPALKRRGTLWEEFSHANFHV